MYVPVAVNCSVVPNGSVGIAGVTAIDTSTAAVTVTVAEPLIVDPLTPDVAVILVLPSASPLTIPVLPTPAIAVFALLQVTFVSTNVLPSL